MTFKTGGQPSYSPIFQWNIISFLVHSNANSTQWTYLCVFYFVSGHVKFLSSFYVFINISSATITQSIVNTTTSKIHVLFIKKNAISINFVVSPWFMGIKFKRAMMSSERKTNNKEFRVSLPNIIYAKDAMSYVFVCVQKTSTTEQLIEQQKTRWMHIASPHEHHAKRSKLVHHSLKLTNSLATFSLKIPN